MEAIIRYANRKDFEEITAFGKRNGFTVIDTENREDSTDEGTEWPTKVSYVNGVPIIKRDPSVTLADMAGSFTDMGIDVDELRMNIRRNRV